MIMWQHVLAVFVVRVTLNALWVCCNVYLHLIALGPTQHYTFLWVDRFSKAVHFTSLEKLTTATETAKLLTHHVFRLHGISTKIVSDQGSQLISQVWKTFCFALSAKVCVSSGFHLQITGQLERLNKELETALRCVTFQNPSSWSSQLTLLGYADNALTSSATSFLEADLTMPTVQQQLQRRRQVWTRTREDLLKTVERNQHYAHRCQPSTPSQ